MALVKSDMIAQIISPIGGVPWHTGPKDGYEEVVEDSEVFGSSGEDITNCAKRIMGNRADQFDRSRSQLNLKHKMEVSNLLGTLNPKYLIDQIGELEDYFQLEDIGDLLRVWLAQTKMKGHASLWWKEVQQDREEEGEIKITHWRLKVKKLKAKFIPGDYELQFFERLQNLKQTDMTVKDYIEEFYKLTIWSRHRELSKEKEDQYENGLRFNIQDEVGMLKIYSIENVYHYSLKEEDKFKRRRQGRS